MKIKFTSALNHAPKLFYTVVLSAFLVACGGGGSGDETDSTAGTADSGADTGNGESTFGDFGDDNTAGTNNTAGTTGVESTAGGGTTGGADIVDPLTVDTDGDGTPDVDEACKGQPGEDPGFGSETNGFWVDNCWLRADINPDTPELDQSPFYHSTYTKGIQRIVYCRGHAGVVDSADKFADGYFGIDTDTAVREFQTAEGITPDGIVGPRTWTALQRNVIPDDRDDTSTFIEDASNLDFDYHVYGVKAPVAQDTGIDCQQEIHFYGRLKTNPTDEDRYQSWELSKAAGVDEKGPFSVAPPEVAPAE